MTITRSQRKMELKIMLDAGDEVHQSIMNIRDNTLLQSMLVFGYLAFNTDNPAFISYTQGCSIKSEMVGKLRQLLGGEYQEGYNAGKQSIEKELDRVINSRQSLELELQRACDRSNDAFDKGYAARNNEIETLKDQIRDLRLRLPLKMITSTQIGQEGETMVLSVLKKYMPSWNFEDTAKTTACGDINMSHPQKTYTILIEVKNKQTVTKEDMEKFRRDLYAQQQNGVAGGIFVSLRTTNIPGYGGFSVSMDPMPTMVVGMENDSMLETFGMNVQGFCSFIDVFRDSSQSVSDIDVFQKAMQGTLDFVQSQYTENDKIYKRTCKSIVGLSKDLELLQKSQKRVWEEMCRLMSTFG